MTLLCICHQLRGALVEDLARTDWLDSAALNSSRDFLTNVSFQVGIKSSPITLSQCINVAIGICSLVILRDDQLRRI